MRAVDVEAVAAWLIIYVIWDRRGDVEDYVAYALAGLREHAAHILVVVNGALTEAGRAKLEPVATRSWCATTSASTSGATRMLSTMSGERHRRVR